NDGSPRFTLTEELFLADFLGLGMMAHEYDLHLIVLGLQEADHPEVEGPRYIFLELAHRAADVHHRYHDGIALVLDLFLPGFVPEIFLLEGTHLGLAGLFGAAPKVFQDRAPLVQV